MNILNNKYLKIFFLLSVAYIISNFFIKNIFLANSPKLNPFFVQNMFAKKTITPNNNTYSQNIEEALNVPLKKVSQGVYAGEKNNIKVFEIRTGELEYLEYTFKVNGKEVKIKVPKGQEAPSPEVMDVLYK